MIQHRKKKSNKKHIITIIILILLIIFSGKNPESLTLPSNIFNTVISPINRVFYSLSNSIKEGITSILSPINLRETIEKKDIEIKRKDEEIRKLRSIIASQDFLEAEYKLREDDLSKYEQAYVTAMDPFSQMRRFNINIGKNKGIKVNDTVVQGVLDEDGKSIEALIGRVVEVGLNYSKVSAINDDINDLSFRSQRSQELGIINKKDGKILEGSMLSNTSDISLGDSIVSSGVGEIYPKDIYIGRVVYIEDSKDGLEKKLTIESPVDFDKLYRVLVIKSGESNE